MGLSPMRCSPGAVTFLSCVLLVCARLSGASAQPVPDAAPEDSRDLALIETETRGVDPVVGRFFNQRIKRFAAALGYRVRAPQDAREAMTRFGLGYPPSPSELWTLMHALSAKRVVFATVWISGGQYAFRLQVGSADGAGPYFSEATVTPADLLSRLEETLTEVLPPPGMRFEVPGASAALAQDAAEGALYFDTAGPPPVPVPRHRPWRLAMHGDTAFGFSSDGFRNHTLGARLDYRFDRELALGAYVGYANLAGRDGRVASLLAYLQFEDRVPINRRGTLHVPLRLGLGYLAKNGPVMRLAAGFGFNMGDQAEATLELLAPTFWLTQETLLFSLDLGVEVGFKL